MTTWTVANQTPLSMGFSRQEYWSGLPCSPPGDLSIPGIEPGSLMSPALAGGFFTTSAIILDTVIILDTPSDVPQYLLFSGLSFLTFFNTSVTRYPEREERTLPCIFSASRNNG